MFIEEVLEILEVGITVNCSVATANEKTGD